MEIAGIKLYNISMLKLNRGAASGDLLWFLLVLVGLWLLWILTGGPTRPGAISSPFINSPIEDDGAEVTNSDPSSWRVLREDVYGGVDSEDENLDPNLSPWFEQIKIYRGNAASEYRPGQEYIILRPNYDLEEPVILTGWQLVNSPVRRNQASVAIIPGAINLPPPLGNGAILPVILTDDGEVVIISGVPPNREAWPLKQSFQINKCVGYLTEEFDTLNLEPSLPRACPAPREESGVAYLPEKCYDFVRGLRSCHKPKFTEDREGVDRVDGRVDDLTRDCRLYVQEHFSYDRCLVWHGADEDFLTADYRVYLDKNQEMWAESREVISLYDNLGRLVNEISY